MPEWVKRLMEQARDIVPRDFVGQIEINAFKGGIACVNVKQSFKADESEPLKTCREVATL